MRSGTERRTPLQNRAGPPASPGESRVTLARPSRPCSAARPSPGVVTKERLANLTQRAVEPPRARVAGRGDHRAGAIDSGDQRRQRAEVAVLGALPVLVADQLQDVGSPIPVHVHPSGRMRGRAGRTATPSRGPARWRPPRGPCLPRTPVVNDEADPDACKRESATNRRARSGRRVIPATGRWPPFSRSSWLVMRYPSLVAPSSAFSSRAAPPRTPRLEAEAAQRSRRRLPALGGGAAVGRGRRRRRRRRRRFGRRGDRPMRATRARRMPERRPSR